MQGSFWAAKLRDTRIKWPYLALKSPNW